ncbi:MAG: transglutaminase domain-containing protein, partial [Clostridia bacterium]|nr:transglutaminase domain-containing protein [Clostridia bacterium]
MKKYLITIIAVILLVVSLYALDGFGIVNIPLNDAKVTVKIFKQDAETGEFLLEEQTRILTDKNQAYEYIPQDIIYYDIDFEKSNLKTETATSKTILCVYYSCELCTVTFIGGDDATLLLGEDSFSIRKGQTPTPPEYYLQGYEVVGYDRELTKIYEDTVFTAEWEVANYTLTLIVPQGAIINASDYINANGYYEKSFTFFDETFELPECEYSGYIFKGWYDSNSESAVKYSVVQGGMEGDFALYARFDIVTYEMSFVAPAGYSFYSIIAPENEEVYPPVIPAEKQIPGYGLNWYTDIECESLYTFTVMPKNGITLYGKWEKDTGAGIWGDYNFDNLQNTIDSQEELVCYLDFVTFNYLTQSQSVAREVTFANATEIEENMQNYIALTEYFGTFSLSYRVAPSSKVNSKASLLVYVDENCKQNEAIKSTQSSNYGKYNYSTLSFKGSGRNTDKFYIDGIVYSKTVETTNQLVYAVEHGFKPLCKSGSPAEKAYLQARAILNEILQDGYTDYEKALVIFEYLSVTVEYDLKAVELASSGTNFSWGEYDAFYLEGVFNNKKAVCDGISKAFSLMCNIEGIPCVQVTGNAHAWCKIKINNRWSIVDPTHGN